MEMKLSFLLLEKQRVQQWRRAVWSDEDRSGGQRPPDQRRHGPGACADVSRQTHTDTAGHCLSQFTHTDRGQRLAHINMCMLTGAQCCFTNILLTTAS